MRLLGLRELPAGEPAKCQLLHSDGTEEVLELKQLRIPAVYMRGGTSKGVFFLADDLPSESEARDQILLRVIGSPDPYGKQIDGMGGATSSTSKVVIISKSQRPDCNVDYLFGQVAIDAPFIDWSGNCGNLTAAVGPFAIGAGLLDAPPDGTAPVRIWQANIGKKIIAHVPMHAGEVLESGSFQLDGIAFPGAELKLEFIDPAGEDGEPGAGATFPTGHQSDQLEIPGLGAIEATLINAGNPTIFVAAASLGLKGTELQQERQRQQGAARPGGGIARTRRGGHGTGDDPCRGHEQTAQHPQARIRRKADRVHHLRRQAHRPAVDRPSGADLLHGQTAPCDDRHGRRGHRCRSGDSRNHRAPRCASLRGRQRAIRASLRHPQRRCGGGPAGQRMGHQKGDREPLSAAADGRVGPGAGLTHPPPLAIASGLAGR